VTYRQPKVTFLGYDRDNDMLWEVEDKGFVIANDTSEALAANEWRFSPTVTLDAYIRNFGPLTSERK
jgi:hypothetical protein